MRRGTDADVTAAAELAVLLWDHHTAEELAEEFGALIGREDAAVFLCYEGARPVGFAQCQLRRDYVEGTESSPVGYLEGIFVREDNRGRGYARQLLQECQRWAREQGCREFASDCELENHQSLAFHMAVGFTEANRIICFTKQL